MLTTSHHWLGCHVFADDFQEDLLSCFPWDSGEADQSASPQTSVPALFEDRSVIYFLAVFGNFPQSQGSFKDY